MPRLSDSMEEGTVLRWMKSVGDDVALGEELVEIETDKANMVFEADAAGTLIEIVADEGATLPIGEVIARVGAADEVAPAAAVTTATGRARRTVLAPLRIVRRTLPTPPPPPPRRVLRLTRPRLLLRAAPAGGERADGRVKASPIARRIAEEKGVDLGTLQGSGPGGTDHQVGCGERRRGRRAHRRPPPPRRRRRRVPARRRPPRARCRSSSSQSSSRRSAGGWPSPRRPRRTSICSRSST